MKHILLLSLAVIAAAQPPYRDGRPQARLRLNATDAGPVLRHGDGPQQCDLYGARDVWVWEHKGTYYMHYDAAGPTGWLAALATSRDLVHWDKKGAILEMGGPSDEDSKSASYGVTFLDRGIWHMFYLGTPNTSPAPDRIPAFPYLTMKAKSKNPAGPWTKQRDVIPFRPKPDSYYDVTASPGFIVKTKSGYLQFFSAARYNKADGKGIQRTISIARTRNLDGPWTIDPAPIVPLEEQIENSSLYYEKANKTWFLFTNHVGIPEKGGEYTDAIWVYWTKDLNHWDPSQKAVVLDSTNCKWSKGAIGLPSVVRRGKRLAVLYDGNAEGSTWHMRRDVGLAWLDLPLRPPQSLE